MAWLSQEGVQPEIGVQPWTASPSKPELQAQTPSLQRALAPQVGVHSTVAEVQPTSGPPWKAGRREGLGAALGVVGAAEGEREQHEQQGVERSHRGLQARNRGADADFRTESN
ncbi:MAG: hypothetical protein CO108_31025 [Deltaproteobacteria bacterium CG_4_9_14_3_um_filter_63_12]|nr:MAG: hypothetical protein CO108_31025 [Deltaproteobacteria bacterium CG_4_9_14_3_um_filter_63_12]